MTDPVRSALMSRIRGKETEPEVLLRKALWKLGLRYRKNAKTPVGRPDIVIASKKVAIFIDGCFWHGCPEHYVRPRSRGEFWAAKLKENVERDMRQVADLVARGWLAVRVWEHQVMEDTDATARAILDVLHRRGPGIDSATWRVLAVEPFIGDLEKRDLIDLHRGARTSVVQRRSTQKWRTGSQGRPQGVAVPHVPSRSTRRPQDPAERPELTRPRTASLETQPEFRDSASGGPSGGEV